MTNPSALCQLPPHVTPLMLQPDFWLNRIADPDAPLLDGPGIAAFNTRVYDVLGIPPVLGLPDTLPASEVRAALGQYGRLSAPHYDPDGRPLGDDDWQALLDNASPDLPDPVPVRRGLAVQRTDVRTFPTAKVATQAPFDFAFDRFQETTIDVGWPVAVLADSRDERWFFCLTPHYWGWVRRYHVGFGPPNVVVALAEPDPFVVVTASRALVAMSHASSVTPQMGTRLKLIGQGDDAYAVYVPVWSEHALIYPYTGTASKASGDLHIGYRPLTLRTLFEQAFILLGEPYAWGGSRLGIFGRDCSRLVRDVYATAGVSLPRNGSQQGEVCSAQAVFTPEMDADERRALLVEAASPGALLVLPGHIMLYLGHVDGRPYAIHDSGTPPYTGVIVSDLSLGEGTESGSLLARLTVAALPG